MGNRKRTRKRQSPEELERLRLLRLWEKKRMMKGFRGGLRGYSNREMDNRHAWLKEFVDENEDIFDNLPLYIGRNCFEIDKSNYSDTKSELIEIGTQNKDCSVFVMNIDPVLEDPNILELMIKRNISVFEFYNTEGSLQIHKLMKSFAKITSNELADPKNTYVQKAANTRKDKAIETALKLKETIADIEEQGKTSLRAIAEELTKKSVPTPSGKPEWNATTVKRMKDRLDNLE